MTHYSPMYNLELLILSRQLATRHIPNIPTHAIRIRGTDKEEFQNFGTLQNSNLYTDIKKYVFDDVTYNTHEEEGADVMSLNPYVTKDLLSGFQTYLKTIKAYQRTALLIHCRLGESRSPAVAMALNDRFNLGFDTFVLSKQYPHYNAFVYKTLMDWQIN